VYVQAEGMTIRRPLSEDTEAKFSLQRNIVRGAIPGDTIRRDWLNKVSGSGKDKTLRRATGTMRTLAHLLLPIATITASVVTRADEPLSPPATKEVWSPNKKFCAVMEPQPATTTVFRVTSDGKRTKSWTMSGWFRVADLADDGEHLVVGNGGMNLLPLNVTKDEPMIDFFQRGKRITTVRLGELFRDPSSLKRTVSHYLWGNYLGLDENGRYVVETVEGQKLLFDVTTGRPAPAAVKTHEDAEKQAVAVADGWLAVVDGGKYEASWDAASNDLRKAISRKDFAKSLAAARQPLGKLKSREVKTKQYRTNLPGAPSGEYVVIQFKSVFEKKKSAIETVTPKLDSDGTWRVSGYYIR
jgi:hypothetical protein